MLPPTSSLAISASQPYATTSTFTAQTPIYHNRMDLHPTPFNNSDGAEDLSTGASSINEVPQTKGHHHLHANSLYYTLQTSRPKISAISPPSECRITAASAFDASPGLNQADLAKSFAPFQQLHPLDSSKTTTSFTLPQSRQQFLPFPPAAHQSGFIVDGSADVDKSRVNRVVPGQDRRSNSIANLRLKAKQFQKKIVDDVTPT